MHYIIAMQTTAETEEPKPPVTYYACAAVPGKRNTYGILRVVRVGVAGARKQSSQEWTGEEIKGWAATTKRVKALNQELFG